MTTVEVPDGPVPRRVGVAVSTFNQPITDALAEGAIARLERDGVEEITVLRVPGAWELPVAAEALLDAGCAAVVAVGAVIEGETDHYRIVADAASHGIAEVARRRRRPVTNAVLAVREYEHAVERSRPGPGNKGAEAAEAAVVTARRLAGLGGLDQGPPDHPGQPPER